MNAEPTEESPFTPGDTYQGMPVPRAPMALTVAERAAAVFTAVPSEEDLRELAKKSATITEITNEDGKSQCHAARMVLKNTRLEIARVGEVGREDAVQTSKAIIALQKSRIALISGEEARLQAIQDAWDARIEREKEAKIQAEIARVADIQGRIEEIRAMPVHATNLDSLMLGQVLSRADSMTVDPQVFEEFTQNATDALTVTRAALTGLLATRKAFEAKELQAEEDRKELARLRSEQLERDRLAREAQAKADADAKLERDRLEAIAKAERDAEAARAAEANRIERARIAQEEADAKVIRDTEARRLVAERLENDRIARERQEALDRQAEEQRQANAVEAGRIAAARAQFEADQEAARKAAEPKPEPVKAPAMRHVERPSTAQIVACVAKKWAVSHAVATQWVAKAKIELQQAAA